MLYELYADPEFVKNTLVVRLDGLLDTDDGIALKSATQQMQLDNVVAGKVFGSYAENLSFLLACLRSGQKDESKCVIFVLDHFDLFCAHPKQALLYNLFDVVQSAQAPLCVIGLTCRQDVLELLEKRVKSRFSHRQISLFPGDMPFADHLLVYKKMLALPMCKVGYCTIYVVLMCKQYSIPPLQRKSTRPLIKIYVIRPIPGVDSTFPNIAANSPINGQNSGTRISINY